MILKSYFKSYLDRRSGASNFTCAGEVETNLEDLIQVFRSTYISEINKGVETIFVYQPGGNYDFIEGSESEIQALNMELETIMRSYSPYADGGHLD